MATQKAIVIHQYGKLPSVQQIPKVTAKEGQLLIKVDGSTINPSDRMRIEGSYFPVALPSVAGFEGTGRVVDVNGQHLKQWIGRRVCFLQNGSGSWTEYAVSLPLNTFPIDEDVPLVTAASGLVNPLTVVGMTEYFNQYPHKKGLIHTAAASALGRQLNKLCIQLGIPLLNIVRRKQQKQLLISEGAKHVIVTSEQNWLEQYKNSIKEHGFNILFDALGGGSVTQDLILNLEKDSVALIYGKLENKPLVIPIGISLSKGITITGFLIFTWFHNISAEKQANIKAKYSSLLKTALKTQSYRILSFDSIEQALELSVSKATEGKITILPNK